VESQLTACLFWVDKSFFLGDKKDVVSAKHPLITFLECNNLGYVEEYVGCKIEMNHDKQEVTFRQPTLIRNLKNKLKQVTRVMN
jgi:hypothetical protein